MTTKHTVQDWMRTGTTVYALNAEGTNRFSAQVQGGWATDGRLRTDEEELEANARLMAAAPALLEALVALFNDYKRLADSGDAGFWNLEDVPEGKQALAAIAKARGEPC